MTNQQSQITASEKVLLKKAREEILVALINVAHVAADATTELRPDAMLAASELATTYSTLVQATI